MSYITECACVCIPCFWRLVQCKNPPGSLLNVSWKSPGKLFGWICRHPVTGAGLRLWRPWFTQKNEAPKIQLGGLGSPLSSPSGVWGGPPAEIEFGVL